MPVYDFQCTKCKHTFEQRFPTVSNYEQELDRSKSIKCPECKATALKVIARVSAPVFHGNGWTPKFY